MMRFSFKMLRSAMCNPPADGSSTRIEPPLRGSVFLEPLDADQAREISARNAHILKAKLDRSRYREFAKVFEAIRSAAKEGHTVIEIEYDWLDDVHVSYVLSELQRAGFKVDSPTLPCAFMAPTIISWGEP